MKTIFYKQYKTDVSNLSPQDYNRHLFLTKTTSRRTSWYSYNQVRCRKPNCYVRCDHKLSACLLASSVFAGDQVQPFSARATARFKSSTQKKPTLIKHCALTVRSVVISEWKLFINGPESFIRCKVWQVPWLALKLVGHTSALESNSIKRTYVRF